MDLNILTEAIKILFDCGVDRLAVEENTAKIIGEFSLKNIKGEIKNK